MVSCDEISKQWIENLKKLDSKNHLNHGEFYARDGSVKDFKIKKNIVTANVEGAPKKTLKVEITFEKFSKNQISQLTDFIQNNHTIYSQLLNNQIPREILDFKMNIFPTSIKHFKMKCECEKGLFCKHKASLFHKIAIEIKKDPFLIFTLHGFDLKKIIQSDTGVKSVEEIMNQENELVLDEYTGLNHLNELNSILYDYPSFYNSNTVNFNSILCDTLNSMPQSIFRILNPENNNEFHEYIILGNSLPTFEYFKSKSSDEIKDMFENKWNHPETWEIFNIDINSKYEIQEINTGVDNVEFQNNNLKFLLFALFAELNHIKDVEYCKNIEFVKEIFLFTSNLIQSNALIPELFELDDNFYHIRWIPVFEKKIYDELTILSEKCPNNLLTFNKTRLSRFNQVLNIVCLFFEGFCSYHVRKSLPYRLNDFKNDKFFRLFFLKSQEFNRLIDKGKEIEIANWLSVLYLKQEDYNLILNTTQKDYKFTLNLQVKVDGELYDLKDINSKNRTDIVKNILTIQNLFDKYHFDYDLSNPRSMDLREYSIFFDRISPVLESNGIKVNVPSEFENVENARLVLNTKIDSDNASLTLDDLTDFDWKIAIGDETFSVDEFETYDYNFRGLIKIKDKYYSLSSDNLKQLKEDILKIPKNNDKTSMMQYLLSVDSDHVEMDLKVKEMLDDIVDVKPVNVPESLNGKLRPYQETGFSWLVQNMQLGFGSILADDMGLGKTIQILTTILYLKENNDLKNEKVLIVAPTSILTNWAKEIEKFTPSLKFEIYHGTNRTLHENEYDILLTSYGMIRQDFEIFNRESWYLLVVDEAQNIKNPKSQQTKAIKNIKSKHHIALSGTPIENHLSEYWSIFDFINKGYLYSLKQFKERFITPIEHDEHDVLVDFRKITSPFILRRLKSDEKIIKDLPDKIVNDIYCDLTLPQAKLYDEVLNQSFDDIESSDGIRRKGLVLKLTNSLKQICNHPSQFLNLEDGKINESGKLEVLINTLENIIESDEKVLIFTQYVKMGELLKKIIEFKLHEEALFLHGSVKRSKRDEMINRFQNDEVKIFILSIKAGGIGLNLTAASNVIHYDLWWNPAVENQATDRAYRIGQDKNVMVYRFITTGTLEENINKILSNKRKLVDLTVDGDESFITEMSDDELRNMLDLRKG